jgi:hypothetical protein
MIRESSHDWVHYSTKPIQASFSQGDLYQSSPSLISRHLSHWAQGQSLHDRKYDRECS